MGINHYQILDIVSVVYYGILIWPAIYLLFRHGHKKQFGWVELVTLAVLRIVGGALGIAAFSSSSFNLSLFIASIVLSSIGLRFLMGAVIALLVRVKSGMPSNDKHLRFLRLLQLPMLVAVILSIVGGTKMSHTTDPSSVSSGKDFYKGSSILYLVALLGITFVVIATLPQARYAQSKDSRLLYASALTLPFLYVRVAYFIGIGFSSVSSRYFSLINPDLVVQGLMSYLMEFMVFAIILVAGLVTPPVDRSAMAGKYPDQNSGHVQVQSQDPKYGGQMTGTAV